MRAALGPQYRLATATYQEAIRPDPGNADSRAALGEAFDAQMGHIEAPDPGLRLSRLKQALGRALFPVGELASLSRQPNVSRNHRPVNLTPRDGRACMPDPWSA
jgi:hypothetical protein